MNNAAISARVPDRTLPYKPIFRFYSLNHKVERRKIGASVFIQLAV